MTIGIIAAMKIEAERIIANMVDPITEECGGVVFTKGKLGQHEAVCSVCGIGKVFAAMCAQTMIIKYHPDFIVNTGVAGTLTKKLTVGDIAVSDGVVQHDMDTSPIGDPIGLISGINKIEIEASGALAERIYSLASSMGIKCVRGIIASGDKFVADSRTKQFIVDQFSAIACEMEGAAVGQVCHVNKVPFVIIRAISDDADSGACEDYPTFAAKAAENSANLVLLLAGENAK